MDLTGFTLDELTGSLRRERMRKLIDYLDHLYDHTEENVRRWQSWRDRGLVRPEVAFHVIGKILECMVNEMDEKLSEEEPLKGLYDKEEAICKREGLEDNDEYFETFVEGEEPKDWLAVRRKIEKVWAAHHAEMMRKHGERDMAELYLRDKAEYDRRSKAGKALLYAEPELAEAKRFIDEVQAEALKEYEEKREKELEAERLEKENAKNEGRKDD
jgi:hypothetical protein